MAIQQCTAAQERLLQSRRTPAAITSDIDLTRLYRAYVSPADCHGAEACVFIEAGSRDAAIRKIAGCLAVLEYRTPEDVAERIYNLAHAEELLAENLSADHASRLFECGWSGDRVTCWVQAPLVLTRNPGPLLSAWARLPREIHEQSVNRSLPGQQLTGDRS